MKELKIIALFVFLITFGILGWYTKPSWIILLGLSRQGTIDPQNLSGKLIPENTATFNNVAIPLPVQLAQENLEQPKVETTVLGDSDAPKRIEIDLTNQHLYAYEGDRQVYNFLVSTGKWARTPTGHFKIWVKLRYTKMSGGSQALGTYYYLPNVPYVMFFYGDGASQAAGFSLHGTYWHSNFGHPMSHGCINMKTSEVEQLYYWAKPDLQGKDSVYASADNPGTDIIIYGEAPWE